MFYVLYAVYTVHCALYILHIPCAFVYRLIFGFDASFICDSLWPVSPMRFSFFFPSQIEPEMRRYFSRWFLDCVCVRIEIYVCKRASDCIHLNDVDGDNGNNNNNINNNNNNDDNNNNNSSNVKRCELFEIRKW